MSQDVEASRSLNDLDRLEAEIKVLRASLASEGTSHGTPKTRAKRKSEKKRSHHRRKGTVVLAPGYVATTKPGSIYSVLLQQAAKSGNLAAHDVLFSAFEKDPTVVHAKRLIKKIGVPQEQLERNIRGDSEFRAHCQKRTHQLKARAAQGDERAKRALANPDRCTANGRWHGNIVEAVDTLYGARDLVQLRRGKNVRILHKIGLMFDVFDLAGTRYCVLYPERHHKLFSRALSLLEVGV